MVGHRNFFTEVILWHPRVWELLFQHTQTQPSYLTPELWTQLRAKGHNNSQDPPVNIQSSWGAAVWLGDTDRLEQLKFPRLAPRAYPLYPVKTRTQVIILRWNSVRRVFPSSLTKHTDTASPLPEEAIFEYFVWWVQTEKRWISRRLVLEQKINHWEIHPPPAGSFRRLCVARAQRHMPFNGGWPGWHALSSFLSHLSGLCTLGAFLLGTPHSTRQRSWHLNKRKPGPPLASQRPGLRASHTC